MRREVLFSLVGFLGGFVAAAIVFWQPVAPAEGTPKPVVTEAVSPRSSTPVTAGEHARRPLVVSARENEGVAPIADSAPQAKGPAEIFHEAIGGLKNMDPNRRQAAIESLMKQLRAAGPEGFQVVRDYFRAGQDVKFQNGYTIVNGKMVQTPSLRTALLNVLGDWPGGEAIDLTREILRTTSQMNEASIAISQLEKSAPGTYRAEAIQAIQQLAGKPLEKDAWAMNGAAAIFDAMKQFKAAELLPAAEAFVGKNPMMATQYIAALDALPADVRTPALQRLFANESVTKGFASNPWSLQQLNYSEPVVAQNVAQMFTANTDKKFRENFLTTFPNGQMFAYSGGGVTNVASGETATDRTARLQGRLAFLDQIAPQANTPVLQERLQDARAELQKAIANPPDPSKAGARGLNTGSTFQIGGGGGSTVIQSDSGVQILQLQPGK